MTDPDLPLTQWMRAWHQGDDAAFDALIAAVHADLLRMAASRLRMADGQTLSRNDLLHEALLRVMQQRPAWNDRQQFFATLSLTMRSTLIDHVRARLADKRGGGAERVSWTLVEPGEGSMDADLINLDQLLTRLQRDDERAARILELTYFVGLEREAVAAVMELSLATVDRELRFARAWLAEQLGQPV